MDPSVEPGPGGVSLGELQVIKSKNIGIGGVQLGPGGVSLGELQVSESGDIDISGIASNRW